MPFLFLKNSSFRAALLGVLVGLLMVPPHVTQAQWTVFDPKVWSELWSHRFEENARWTERVQFYVEAAQKTVKMISQNAEMISSTHNILDLAEKTMLKNEKLARNFAEIGKTVRAVFSLQQKIHSLVYRDIKGMREIYTRMQGGIFDPDANRRDLETYLRYSIGLVAEEFFLHKEQLAAMDPELARWFDETLAIEGNIAILNKQIEDVMVDLENNTENGKEPIARAALFAKLEDLDRRLDEQKAQHSQMISKIEERYRRYHLLLGSRRDSALAILKQSKAWEQFLQFKMENERLAEEEAKSYVGEGN